MLVIEPNNLSMNWLCFKADENHDCKCESQITVLKILCTLDGGPRLQPIESIGKSGTGSTKREFLVVHDELFMNHFD